MENNNINTDRGNIDKINSHLEQWQELSRKINEQLSPTVIRLQESLQSSLPSISQAMSQLGKSLEFAFVNQEPLLRIGESLSRSLMPTTGLAALTQLSDQIQELQKAIQISMRPIFEHLHKSFSELPSRTKEALLLLGEHGWYLDLDMAIPDLFELRNALYEGNITEAEQSLTKYFESRVDDIEKSVIEKFPHRKKLLTSAFDAHRQGKYELSIPVLLAQTDGICKDVTKQYFFMRFNGKPQTARFVEGIAEDTLKATLLSPLAQDLPITASEHGRRSDWKELNRHMVMHGEALDYGNKVNGLKAISLVNYVAHVLN